MQCPPIIDVNAILLLAIPILVAEVAHFIDRRRQLAKAIVLMKARKKRERIVKAKQLDEPPISM